MFQRQRIIQVSKKRRYIVYPSRHIDQINPYQQNVCRHLGDSRFRAVHAAEQHGQTRADAVSKAVRAASAQDAAHTI